MASGRSKGKPDKSMTEEERESKKEIQEIFKIVCEILMEHSQRLASVEDLSRVTEEKLKKFWF